MAVQLKAFRVAHAFPILCPVNINEPFRKNSLLGIEIVLPADVHGSIPLVALRLLIQVTHVLGASLEIVIEDRRNNSENCVILSLIHEGLLFCYFRVSIMNIFVSS